MQKIIPGPGLVRQGDDTLPSYGSNRVYHGTFSNTHATVALSGKGKAVRIVLAGPGYVRIEPCEHGVAGATASIADMPHAAGEKVLYPQAGVTRVDIVDIGTDTTMYDYWIEEWL